MATIVSILFSVIESPISIPIHRNVPVIQVGQLLAGGAIA
jgi:hypothetical protein